jgi:aryl-alcohol dehydrogenase-like predicted oxidoreductase
VSRARGLGRLRTEQPPYSLLARGVEASVLPVAQRYGMGVLVWSPLAFGFLTGRYRTGRPIDMTSGRPALAPGRLDMSIPANAEKLEVVERLVEVAEGIGCSLPELALAFTCAHPAVTSTIIGPRTVEQLEASLKCASRVLDDATLDRIDEIVPPGTNVYTPDGVWRPRSLIEATMRRRPLAERAAA